MHKFDVICISKTFLNSTYEYKDLPLNGYSLLCAVHAKNVKKGGVCIYFKETVGLKMILIPTFK